MAIPHEEQIVMAPAMAWAPMPKGAHADIDPTPWCSGCGSMTRSGCHCGPIAQDD